MTDAFLSADDVAGLLQTSKRTVWRMVASGALPQPFRFSRKLVRWSASLISAWQANHHAQANKQNQETTTLPVSPVLEIKQ